MTIVSDDRSNIITAEEKSEGWIYKQRLVTRVTHWIWAVSLFFLLLSGLQIFNATPRSMSASSQASDSTTPWCP